MYTHKHPLGLILGTPSLETPFIKKAPAAPSRNPTTQVA